MARSCPRGEKRSCTRRSHRTASPVTGRAIVIEGYANGGVPADQLRISRSRAMAVRQYVQQQFELDSKDLGAVPMNSAPPKGVARATWDGVCIVVLLGN